MLRITPSLASAFRRLRCAKLTVRRVWADAVCINQGDTADKGRQIPLMSLIYRGASRVVVWLDPGETFRGDSEARARRLNELIRRRSVRREVLHGGALSEAAGLLEEHFAMPWFNRRWIIQEVVGHADVDLLCGAEEMGWLPLMALAMNVFEDVKAAPAVVTSALMMYDLWRMCVVGEPRSGKCRLTKLLERFEHFGCADDRDRIYALAGLAEDGHGDDALAPINMDYSVSTEQLYTRFAEQLIKAGYLSWVLQQACARRCTNKGLPSWVPDWRVPPTTKTFWEDTAGILKWEASVEQAGIGAHALTAHLYCLVTMKKDPRERIRPEDGTNDTWRPWYKWLGLEVEKTGTKVQKTGPEQGRIFELSAGDYQDTHLDVSPLEVEWKNCEEYPRGGGPPALRTWILDTASKIRERDLKSETEWWFLPGDYVPNLSETRAHLQNLLVKGCDRHRGRPESATKELEKVLDDYISGGVPTADVELLVEDVDALMSGRCIFSCRLWSSLGPRRRNVPTMPMGIGPSETTVGDRVVAFQPRSGSPQRWVGDHAYVVREQLVQTASLFPSRQDQIPISLSKCLGFRLVGDCFLSIDCLPRCIGRVPGGFDEESEGLDYTNTGLFFC